MFTTFFSTQSNIILALVIGSFKNCQRQYCWHTLSKDPHMTPSHGRGKKIQVHLNLVCDESCLQYLCNFVIDLHSYRKNIKLWLKVFNCFVIQIIAYHGTTFDFISFLKINHLRKNTCTSSVILVTLATILDNKSVIFKKSPPISKSDSF